MHQVAILHTLSPYVPEWKNGNGGPQFFDWISGKLGGILICQDHVTSLVIGDLENIYQLHHLEGR